MKKFAQFVSMFSATLNSKLLVSNYSQKMNQQNYTTNRGLKNKRKGNNFSKNKLNSLRTYIYSEVRTDQYKGKQAKYRKDACKEFQFGHF